jgi:hypothetical protein
MTMDKTQGARTHATGPGRNRIVGRPILAADGFQPSQLLDSAKGTTACHQTGNEPAASPWGGTPSAQPVLGVMRGFLDSAQAAVRGTKQKRNSAQYIGYLPVCGADTLVCRLDNRVETLRRPGESVVRVYSITQAIRQIEEV